MRQRGFTLIEMIIAITLLSAISAGMLIAMRGGLLTMSRVEGRLDANRRAVGLQNLIRRQLGGAIPAEGICGENMTPIFRGTADTLLMVSSHSLTESDRGAARILLYRVLPEPGGTLQLVVHEFPFGGPLSSASLCQGREEILIPQQGPPPYILATGLASCRFAYRVLDPVSAIRKDWIPEWRNRDLPGAIQIEMLAARPDPGGMPVLSVTAPLHITKRYGDYYE